MNAAVYALAVGPDGSLYAGGSFTTAGGVAASAIARWDGGAWYSLATGMGGDVYFYVYALTAGPDISLYAGGKFTTAGGVVANHIARWDQLTSSWHALGSGMSGQSDDSYVNAMAVRPDGSLYAGGRFEIAGGVPSSNIALERASAAPLPASNAATLRGIMQLDRQGSASAHSWYLTSLSSAGRGYSSSVHFRLVY